jgi:hypothetical protein
MHAVTRLVMLLVLGLVPPARAADVCGDADGNGSVTVSDGVQTLRAAADLSSTCTPARCDLDGGGSITVTDGVNVLRAAAGLSVSLACPGGGPTCTSATITVSLRVPEPIGAATLTLQYPTAVSLPGSGDAAAARVTVLTSSSLLGNGSPNDRDDRVEFLVITPDGVGNGDLLAVRFDCAGPAPTAGAFGCALTDVTAPDGVTPVAGATCGAAVAVE